jgi:LmbE family N-acetylglucosaminyl deacetylase
MTEVLMIDLINPKAELFFPDDTQTDLRSTTHLGIGAHQDDLEIFAIHGILEAYQNPERHFTGVTVTDGRGAPRSGPYEAMNDDQLWETRCEEQKKAASIGEYLAQFLLNYASSRIKSSQRSAAVKDITIILEAARPAIIYTHNLADKHDTHVAVALCVIEALRNMDPPLKDVKLYGCEVWRGLDWLSDADKIALDVSQHPDLQEALLNVFDSQIGGGKRYDLATIGRRLANATYFQSHAADAAERLVYAMDLTPLVHNPTMDIDRFISSIVLSFASDITDRIVRLQGAQG